jgi:hypothetical protein
MAVAIEQLGREHGAVVATHHEVAEWLETLCGPDLLRRRLRVGSIAKSEAPPAPERERPASVTLSVPVTPARSRRPPVAWIAAVALLLAAGAVWALATRSTPAPVIVEAPSATPVTEAATPAPANDAVAVDATPPAPSASSAPAAAAVKRPNTKLPAARTEPSRAPGVRPPDQISKRNPYRE